MAYLSELIGKVVTNLNGERISRIGRLEDLVASVRSDVVHPQIVAYRPEPHDLFLARDVLDKQLIDTNGMRVVRVNDVDLARVNGDF